MGETDNTLISVIVPVYNSRQDLDACINSICTQTHQNLQIILIDDGSTDGSGQLCDVWKMKDKRVAVLHQDNRGAAAARNAGLDAASGDWIAFADCDDRLEPDMLSYLLGLAQKYQAQVAQCGFWEEHPSGNIKILFCAREEGSFFACLPELSATNFDAVSYSLFNKLYRRVWIGEQRLNERLKLGEDLEFNLRMLCTGCCLAIGQEAKYHYRIHYTSISHSTPDIGSLTGTHDALKQIQRLLREQGAYSRLVCDEQLRDCLDVCSKLVCARNKQWSGLEAEMRQEIHSNYGDILFNRRFSAFEKGKFTLIRFLWPIYRRLIPFWKNLKTKVVFSHASV